VVVDRGDCDAKRTEDFEPKSQQRDCRESGVVRYRAPSWEVEIRRASRLASARDSSALSYHLAQMGADHHPNPCSGTSITQHLPCDCFCSRTPSDE
jgi:hypothetical protein